MPVVNYLWDEVEDNVIAEYDDEGNTLAQYTTEPYRYGDLISQNRNGEKSYYHFDGQGSTRALTDENENVTDTYTYTAFGEEVAKTGTTENPFRYVGEKGYYFDKETEDYYVRRRVYGPAVGRWTSVDPNRIVDRVCCEFGYSLNSPVNVRDPSGRVEEFIVSNEKDPSPQGKPRFDVGGFVLGTGQSYGSPTIINQLFLDYNGPARLRSLPNLISFSEASSRRKSIVSFICDKVCNEVIIHPEEGWFRVNAVADVDLFGWSRGAVVVAAAANRLGEGCRCSVTRTETRHHFVGVSCFGINWTTETTKKYIAIVHPRIRFLGLIDPVGMGDDLLRRDGYLLSDSIHLPYGYVALVNTTPETLEDIYIFHPKRYTIDAKRTFVLDVDISHADVGWMRHAPDVYKWMKSTAKNVGVPF